MPGLLPMNQSSSSQQPEICRYFFTLTARVDGDGAPPWWCAEEHQHQGDDSRDEQPHEVEACLVLRLAAAAQLAHVCLKRKLSSWHYAGDERLLEGERLSGSAMCSLLNFDHDLCFKPLWCGQLLRHHYQVFNDAIFLCSFLPKDGEETAQPMFTPTKATNTGLRWNC